MTTRQKYDSCPFIHPHIIYIHPTIHHTYTYTQEMEIRLFSHLIKNQTLTKRGRKRNQGTKPKTKGKRRREMTSPVTTLQRLAQYQKVRSRKYWTGLLDYWTIANLIPSSLTSRLESTPLDYLAQDQTEIRLFVDASSHAWKGHGLLNDKQLHTSVHLYRSTVLQSC